MGMILLPFFGFSQQEEPKRVSIVINLKQIKGEKEIIQLPAINLPATVGALYKQYSKTISSSKKNNQSSRSIVKENLAQKKPNIAVAKTKPTAKELNVIAKSKPIPPAETTATTKTTTSIVAPKSSTKNDVVPNIKPNSTHTETNASKEVKKIQEETTASLKLKTDTNDTVKVSHGAKVNSFSYIWIGIFLIAAGIVLGLLFGKPAFLVSFVGVVFIILGLIIQSK